MKRLVFILTVALVACACSSAAYAKYYQPGETITVAQHHDSISINIYNRLYDDYFKYQVSGLPSGEVHGSFRYLSCSVEDESIAFVDPNYWSRYYSEPHDDPYAINNPEWISLDSADATIPLTLRGFGSTALVLKVEVLDGYRDDGSGQKVEETKVFTYRFPIEIDKAACSAELKQKTKIPSTLKYGEKKLAVSTVPHATVVVESEKAIADDRGKAVVKIPSLKIGSQVAVKITTPVGAVAHLKTNIKGYSPKLSTSVPCVKSKTLTVKTAKPLHKGDYVVVKYGAKKLKKTIKKDGVAKLKYKVRIPSYRGKVFITAYNKYGQKLGKTVSKKVYYAKAIKKGFTKDQVKHTYGYGSPDWTFSADGKTGWYYQDEGGKVESLTFRGIKLVKISVK